LSRRRTLGTTCLTLFVSLGCSGSPDNPTPVDPYPTGPTITCPTPPLPLTSNNLTPIPVQYGTATATGGAPPVLIACTPPSGALFPVGTTAVLCTAVDNRQRTNACTFNVVVRPPAVTLGLTRFLAFGDSITWGEDGDPLVSCGSNNNLTTDTLGRIRPRTQVPQDFRYPTVLQRDLRNATRHRRGSSASTIKAALANRHRRRFPRRRASAAC
jgi:hypothetical protein